MMNFTQPDGYLITVVTWNESEAELTSIRRDVFIDEQEVSEADELDGLDSQCQHVLIIEESDTKGIGCARITNSGKIGRVAIIKSHRGQGIGRDLMRFCTQFVISENKKPYLDAQTPVISFYELLGYMCEGEEFLDANIPHRRMRFGLSSFIQDTHTGEELEEHQNDQTDQSSHSDANRQSQDSLNQAKTLEDSLEILNKFTFDCVGRTYFLCPTSALKYLCSAEFLSTLKQSALSGSDTQLYFVLASYDPSLGYVKPFIELARRLPSKIHLRCLSSTYKEFETLKAFNARNCLEFTAKAEHSYASVRRLSPVKRELEQDEINRILESHSFEHPDFRQLSI